MPTNSDQIFYTVDEHNNRIETFDFLARDVHPIKDYDKIILEVNGQVVASWDSMYDFLNIPF